MSNESTEASERERKIQLSLLILMTLFLQDGESTIWANLIRMRRRKSMMYSWIRNERDTGSWLLQRGLYFVIYMLGSALPGAFKKGANKNVHAMAPFV